MVDKIQSKTIDFKKEYPELWEIITAIPENYDFSKFELPSIEEVLKMREKNK